MSNQSISVEQLQAIAKACVDLERSETIVTGSLLRAKCIDTNLFLLALALQVEVQMEKKIGKMSCCLVL
jgi:hypothetical protein